MSTGDPGPGHQDHPSIVTRNARYGLVLFFIYLIVYGSFVMLAAFYPKVMEKPVLESVNLAVVYGFSLIVLAFVLAMIYMILCSSTGSRGDQQ